MHVLDAAAQTVHAYPGGAESLAPRIGVSAGILRNKVNANVPTNHLTLAEADAIMGATGDVRILQALAQAHGYALTKVDEQSDGKSIVSHVLGLGMTEGKLSMTIHDALADNVITANEMNAIAAAGHAHQSALIGLINRLRAAKSGQPA
jgi:hypothetical protein